MLPQSIRRAIAQPPVTADGLTATTWSSADDKAAFANKLLKFIAEDFRETLFTKALYDRLHSTFGMIAHYDRAGFWSEYFTTTGDKIRFVRALLGHPCFGMAAHTFSDVESIVMTRLSRSGLSQHLEATARQEAEADDRRTYERLRSRFEVRRIEVPQNTPVVTDVATAAPRPTAPAPEMNLRQPSLFDA